MAEWTKHRRDCGSLMRPWRTRCTCGLEDARRRITRAEALQISRKILEDAEAERAAIAEAEAKRGLIY